jgi:hypothetical protein
MAHVGWPQVPKEIEERRSPMALHYTRDGYTFRAYTDGLTIQFGPKPVTLNRPELAQLGLEPRDDYRIRISEEQQGPDVTGRILSALQEAISRCRGPEEAWMAQDLKRAMILVGGLDEEVARGFWTRKGL